MCRSLNDTVAVGSVLYCFQNGVFDMLILALSAKLGDETGFGLLSKREERGRIKAEDVEHFCNLSFIINLNDYDIINRNIFGLSKV